MPRRSPELTSSRTIHTPRLYDLAYAALLGIDRRLWVMALDEAGVLPGFAVLDAGCGTGRLTRAAAERAGPGGLAWGIDASPEMVAFASRKGLRTGSAARFALATIEDLPFEGETFDVVLNTMVLHHLPADAKEAGMAEVYRVLKPGGSFTGIDVLPPDTPLARLLVTPLLRVHMSESDVAGVIEPMRRAGFERLEYGPTRNSWFVRARGVRPERHA